MVTPDMVKVKSYYRNYRIFMLLWSATFMICLAVIVWSSRKNTKSLDSWRGTSYSRYVMQFGFATKQLPSPTMEYYYRIDNGSDAPSWKIVYVRNGIIERIEHRAQ